MAAPGFRTFAGVYRPVLLTILGALLYLREGWLVGNAGLGGAIVVILWAYVITGTTALSVSSIATNLRVRAGGAFAIIAAALGLEAGGAIGVPLFLAQTFGAAMYLYAFAEGVEHLAPAAPRAAVVGAAYVGVGGIVLGSASLAFRAQAVLLVVVAGALVSAWAGWGVRPWVAPTWVGGFEQASVLRSFALFFPAATGIMVGVGMSGSLERPTRSIPLGTLSAWFTSLVVYLVMAVWYATVVPPEVLVRDKLAMVNYAAFGPAVLFGLLASTLTAALSSLVAAPRLLAAMAAAGVAPRWLAATGDTEPRRATLFTLALAGAGLAAGSLDAIAPLITSFFVTTFLAVNLVVALEQSLGMVSWRPRLRIPTWVPWLGVVACVAGLVLSSPGGGLPELAFVVLIYVALSARGVDTEAKAVPSGIATAIASWAALRAARGGRSPRTWKPDLLVPVHDAADAKRLAPVVAATIAHRGSVKFVATADDPALAAALDAIVGWLRDRGRFASWHRMPEESPGQAARLSLNAMQGTFFAPNLLLLSAARPAIVQPVVDHARAAGVGVALVFPEAATDTPRSVAVWLSDRSPDWSLAIRSANLDLLVLLAYLSTRAANGRITLTTVLAAEAARAPAAAFLDDLIDLGRLPGAAADLRVGAFDDQLAAPPEADLHILGLRDRVDVDRLAAIQRRLGRTCLFVHDGGQASALA